ncbi:MAG TPA: Na/Pi cotransporter family protein [Bacteroidales bacterium]|nr:Na/Pi cotransporter family protein [Bacteroidales bacterium]
MNIKKLLLITSLYILTYSLFAQTEGNGIVSKYKLIKPVSENKLNFSGDLQTQTAGLRTDNPLRVMVIDRAKNPVPGIAVVFQKVSFQYNDNVFGITDTLVYTNDEGIAETYVIVGNNEGEYEVSAELKDFPESNFLVYKLFARKTNWVFILSIGLIGGLGLFLLGINMMSDNLQVSAGEKMRSILSKLTNNRFMAVGIGTFVTIIFQSSSATTVMLVSFVHAKLIKFRQTIGVILGAGIGTTITVQLIAFNITDYSLLIIGLGFIMSLFSSAQVKNAGKSILGFGILFYGMYIMSQSMYPLRSYTPFINSIVALENPVIGILVGTLFTALIQSSAAFMGILIILASQGLMSLEASIALLLGANIGTAITAILASIKTNREAKKVALAHTLFKVFGVLIFVWWIPQFAEFVKHISPQSIIPEGDFNALTETVPRQIANAHTLFNVLLTGMVLPLTDKFALLIDRMLPVKEEPKPVLETIYLDNSLIKTSPLALSLAKQEVIRMGKLVQDMATDIIIPFLIKKTDIIPGIEQKEKEVNFLRDQINDYILKITKENVGKDQVNEAFQLLYTVKEFEQIADLISTNMIDKAKSWCAMDYEFSHDGKNEIIEYHTSTQKQICRAIEVFAEVNLEKAKVMKDKYRKYRDMAIALEKQHYERLREEVTESISSSKTHLELMSMLRAINGHATNIARILLKWGNNEIK